MSIDLSGFNPSADSDPIVEYVPVAADATPQAYIDTKKMHRKRQIVALGEPIADHDFDTRWAEYDAINYAGELEIAEMLNQQDEVGIAMAVLSARQTNVSQMNQVRKHIIDTMEALRVVKPHIKLEWHNQMRMLLKI